MFDVTKATGNRIGEFTITRAGQLLPNKAEDGPDRCCLNLMRVQFKDEHGKLKDRFSIQLRKPPRPTWWGEMHTTLARTILIDFGGRLQAAANHATSGGFVQTPLLNDRK